MSGKREGSDLLTLLSEITDREGWVKGERAWRGANSVGGEREGAKEGEGDRERRRVIESRVRVRVSKSEGEAVLDRWRETCV